MNKLQSIATGAAVSMVTIASLAAPALALTGTSTADQCYLVVTHISTIVNTMHDVSDKRETAYNDAAARVSKELTAAQNAGYDATQLAADYKTLNADLSGFTSDRQTFEADLTNVQSASQTGCGSTTGVFVDALAKARAQLPSLRNDDVKIRVDIRQKLILDIRAYISWLQSKAINGTTSE
jgi:hypothetical protein